MDHRQWIADMGKALSMHMAFRWITANPNGNEVELRLWTGDRPKYLRSIGAWVPADDGTSVGVIRCQATGKTMGDFNGIDFGDLISDVTDNAYERKLLETAVNIVKDECLANGVCCPVEEFATGIVRSGYTGNRPQRDLFSKAAHHLRSKYPLSVRVSIEPMVFEIRKSL